MSVLPEIDLEFTERATGCGQKVKNRSLLRNCGVKLVVESNLKYNTFSGGMANPVIPCQGLSGRVRLFKPDKPRQPKA